jgi:outer membrane immunogenic protein
LEGIAKVRARLLTATALSSTTFVVVWTGSAFAAAPVFDWTGFYVGASVGGASQTGAGHLMPLGDPDAFDLYFDGTTPYFRDAGDSAIAYTPWPADFSLPTSGFIGTIGAGYNAQSGNLVFGVEGDASWLAGPAGAFNWVLNEAPESIERANEIAVWGKLDSMFTLRGRVGVAADRLLLFGTGGLAFGEASLATMASLDQDSGKGVADWSGASTAWKTGFVVGGGAEYALTPRTSIKIEGLFYDLGTIRTTAEGTGTWDSDPISVQPYEAALDLSGTILRVGINTRF